MKFENSLKFAKELDKKDPLKSYRSKFHIPKLNGKEVIYFCGNSLGLQPKSARKYIEQEMLDWEHLGVHGHMEAKNPWYYYHHNFTKSLGKLLGAKEQEVVAMNALSVNLNLLMVSFYQPNPKRNKILIENDAFPSDYYAVEQQVKFHGFDPAECIIELKPSQGGHVLNTESILKRIEQYGNEIALVMIGGVNYYTGQYFDLESIAKAAHDVGAFVGYDLAHAIGNVPMSLHDWGVDFATWCSYKYLNSGPGGTSGIFVHDQHANNPELPRFAGWWGNDEKSRFEMPKKFVPQEGAAGWQMSNAPVLSMAVHRASLDIFDEVGMEALRTKSLQLTGFLEFLLKELWKKTGLSFTVITPKNPEERGCQISILTSPNGKEIFDKLSDKGVVADWRKPNVIRVAPVPLYNTYEEVYHFVKLLE